jgi:peptidoglycan hydrolase-like protein with peptidoglycan-binding domain
MFHFNVKRGVQRGVAAIAMISICTVGFGASTARADDYGVQDIGPGPSSNETGVFCIQAALNEAIARGYIRGPYLRLDGILGKNTHRAILRFQYYEGAPQDGIVGTDTGSAIVSLDMQLGFDGCWSYVPKGAL